MEFVLEELQHQNEALKKINKAFPQIDDSKMDHKEYANPLIKYAYEEDHFIDIKMETGTGKTYVYTRMMYELHKRGIFKFVIVVPSPSIKEGTKNFIESDYAKQHFNQFYENTHIQLNVISAGDFQTKGGRKNFPSQLIEFVESTRANTNQIEVLLVNSSMLTNSRSSMWKNDYDQTLINGETQPIKAIATTRPVVVIDEPHRFSETTRGYEVIKELNPQSIIRFGATFPTKKIGRGKNKVEKTHYYQGKPQYNLNAVDSFNRGLVKGIDVIYPTLANEIIKTSYKVKSTSKSSLILQDQDKNEWNIKKGEYLGDINSKFGRITYESGKKEFGILSNGLRVTSGMKLIPGTFAESYQEKIIKQAIDEHFKIEERNFFRINGAPKIKTLSLFFIDSVDSYGRKKVNGHGHEKGWLIKIFEKLLREKLTEKIRKFKHPINEREKEYCEFLEATLDSLNSEHQEVYAGYFSDDRGTSDEDIQAEVDDILKNKEKLISFKDDQNNWITRRFLFSKWTLREGWDNPNVFVIAKLRTLGSESSKIQEVGRGLRLPVDENGQRVHQDEFESRLSFLIGYDEKDFANTLISEINSDATVKLNEDKLTEDIISAIIAEEVKKDPNFSKTTLKNKLGKDNIIDYDDNFLPKVKFNGQEMSGFEALQELYPFLKLNRVANDKVRDMQNHPQPTEIKLRKENWNKLKDIWLKLVNRSMIKFDRVNENQIEVLVKATFTNENNYELQPMRKVTQKVHVDEKATINEQYQDYDTEYETIPYGKFIEQISRETLLQPSLINKYMIRGMKNKDERFINEVTMQNLINDFNTRFNNRFKDHYEYVPLNFKTTTSVYDYEKDDFVDKVSASDIGINSIDSVENNENYLYDLPPIRFDSEDPELDILKQYYSNQKITVYGKLPKKAIKIPRYDYGTTTPDFIFKIENDNSEPKYLMVETKADNLRQSDEQIIQIQKKYFKQLNENNIYYKMATSNRAVQQELRKIQNGEE